MKHKKPKDIFCACGKEVDQKDLKFWGRECWHCRQILPLKTLTPGKASREQSDSRYHGS